MKILAILCLVVISTVLLSGCQNFSHYSNEGDSKIKVINLNKLNEKIYENIGKGRVYAAEFSPNEKILAVGTSISIIFYDTSDYQELRTIPANFVEELEWSPSGNFLAVAELSRFYVYDYSLDKIIQMQDGDQALSTDQISWSPNGNYVAATNLLMYHANAWVWDITSTNKIYDLALKSEFGVYKYANGVSWSPDSKSLAVSFLISNLNGTNPPSQSQLVLWNLTENDPTIVAQWFIPNYSTQESVVPAPSTGKVYWTPDGRFIVITSYNNVSIVDAESGDLHQKFTVPQSILNIWLRNEKLILISGDKSLTVQVYNIPDFNKIDETKYLENPFCSAVQMQFSRCNFQNASISPSASTLVTSSSFYDGFHVLNLRNNVSLKSVFLGSHWNNDLAFSPDSRYVAALGQDGLVRSYNIDDLILLSAIDYKDNLIWTDDGKLKTKLSQSKADYLQLNGNYLEQATEISPDGKLSAHIEGEPTSECFLIFCSTDTRYKLTINNINSNEILRSVEFRNTSMEIKWSPDSNWLITAGDPIDMSASNFGLVIVPIENQKQVFLVADTGPIKGIDWSKNGKYIGVTGYNGIIRIFIVGELIDSFLSNR